MTIPLISMMESEIDNHFKLLEAEKLKSKMVEVISIYMKPHDLKEASELLLLGLILFSIGMIGKG